MKISDEEILAQIKIDDIEIEKGEMVEMPVYGQGKVTAIEGDKITVLFPGGERKTFKKDFAAKV
jgi:hypothetical protein